MSAPSQARSTAEAVGDRRQQALPAGTPTPAELGAYIYIVYPLRKVLTSTVNKMDSDQALNNVLTRTRPDPLRRDPNVRVPDEGTISLDASSLVHNLIDVMRTFSFHFLQPP